MSNTKNNFIFNQRGGFIFKTLFLFLLLGAGLWFWKQWPQNNWQGFKQGQDLTEQSALLQQSLRQLLVSLAVREIDVEKSVNQERRLGGSVWIENSLKINVNQGFSEKKFLQGLKKILTQQGFSLLRQEKTSEQWFLEIGLGSRVFERLMLRGHFQEALDLPQQQSWIQRFLRLAQGTWEMVLRGIGQINHGF